jgi:hypothetical protein
MNQQPPRRHDSIIHVFATAHRDDQDQQLIVFDLAEDAIVADAVSPYPGEVAAQGLAKPAWVVPPHNP